MSPPPMGNRNPESDAIILRLEILKAIDPLNGPIVNDVIKHINKLEDEKYEAEYSAWCQMMGDDL